MEIKLKSGREGLGASAEPTCRFDIDCCGLWDLTDEVR